MASSKDPSVAPYNFVSLPEKAICRYANTGALPDRNKIYLEGACCNGYIDYRIDVKRPVIVSDRTEEKEETGENHKTFFKNNRGEFTIPGSTIRGLVRENVQILGFCNPEEDIADTTFLFREMAGNDKDLRDTYKKELDIRTIKKNESTVAIPFSVKAGYIYQKSKDNYVIVPAKSLDEKTFFHITEMEIRRRLGRSFPETHYMYTERLLDKSKKDFKDAKNAKDDKDDKDAWKRHLKKNKNNNYTPYNQVIHFDYEKNRVCALNMSKNLSQAGYIIGSGFMQGKTAHYVIAPLDNTAAEIIVDNRSIDVYKDDLTRKKLKDELLGFYELPGKIGKENKKPIFYVDTRKRFYFGMTPYLRIFYKHSVGEGIPECLKIKGIDYAQSMFGFIKFKGIGNSYKSRLSFTDAVVTPNTPVELGESTEMILGEPKPTCYPDYLVQKEGSEILSYQNDGFRIRGYKQYWFQDNLTKSQSNEKNKNVAVHVQPITKATFCGRIHFENLSEDELGLLCFALKVEDGVNFNIGMAKPYGYGRIALENITPYLYNMKQLYSRFQISEQTVKPVSTDEYIMKYKDYVKRYKNIDIDADVSVREFKHIKKATLPNEKTRYMMIEKPIANNKTENEFSKKRILPSVMDYEQKHGIETLVGKTTIENMGDSIKKLQDRFNMGRFKDR